MNFSDPIHSAIGLTHASPNAQFIGSASQHELIVRLSSNVQKRCIVQVFSIENPEWTCKVDEGSAGLLSAAWAPDSQHFLTTTEFYIRINVWSLSEVSVCYLKHAKACSGNFAFSPGGRYLALLERRSFHDYLSIFDCRADWNLLRNFQLDTHDSDGLLWSPDGRYLVIWDGCLHYRAAVYTLDGRHLHTFSAYEPGRDFLGIKSVCWSPTGQLLAIGSYDQKCRILNHFNWSCLASLAHPVDQSINPYLGLGPSGRVLHLDDNIGPGVSDHPLHNYRPHRVDVYEEVRHEQQAQSVAYCLRSEPITIQSIRVDPKLPFPKVGIGLVAFSSDGRYLATRNDNAPHVVWLWSIDHRISLFSLLVHTSGPVRSLAWDSSSPARLALCTASDCFFMWTPQGCLVVQRQAAPG
ncbi:unnamed protein product [Dicrocoelium dendriticum]|nr:unnamed protein product [Dicrocoelium dendriticum]